jgi:hypothetical protein
VQRRPGEEEDEDMPSTPSSTASASEAGAGAGAGAEAGNGVAGAGGGRFVPTQAWLDQVKAELPLNTIIRLLRHLVPQILELTSKVWLLSLSF